MNKVFALFFSQALKTNHVFITSCTEEEGLEFIRSNKRVGKVDFYLGEAEEGNKWTKPQDRVYTIPALDNQKVIHKTYNIFVNITW